MISKAALALGWVLATAVSGPLVGQEIQATPLQEDFKSKLPPLPVKTPQQALKTIATRPGFHLQLVAAEPLVRDPIAMAFDENSQLFVVEFPEYNHKHAGWKISRTGTVRLLVDSDGDGLFDRSTIYVDQLNSPTAVACYDGGILVAAAPDLIYCKDTDGDGRADVRKTLFSGFAVSENRGGGARLNSIRWSLDHQFHLCTSFSGGLVRSLENPQQEPVEVRNRGFQFDPRNSLMTVTSGAGQHGLAFDDWGGMYTCRNSDPFKQVMYESRYITRSPYLVAEPAEVNIAAAGKFTKLRRRSPLEPWRVLRTRLRVDGKYRGSAEGGTAGGFFTAATGIVVYRGDAWPERYRGNLFVGEVSNNLVHRATLEGDGLQKIARRGNPEAEFLAASDNWFRPVELLNGPDGNLYVADMHRELIETALALPPEIVKHLKPGSGVNNGRIYRIVHNTGKPKPLPKLGGRSTVQLVGLLDHPNGWHRDTAARLLYERNDPQAVEPLRKLAQQGRTPQGRLLALYSLRGQKSLTDEDCLVALGDPRGEVRGHAIRLAEPFLEDSPVLQAKLLAMASDQDGQVRYQLAFTLGEIAVAARRPALQALAIRDGQDPWIRMALLSSLGRDGGGVFQTLAAHSGFRKTEAGGLFLEQLAQQVGAANEKSEMAGVLKAINSLHPSEKELAVKWVAALAKKQKGNAKKDLLAAAGGKAGELLENLIEESLRRAVDRQASVSQRVEAIRTLRLASYGRVKQLLADSLELQQPTPVQAAALDTLAGFSEDEVARVTIAAWPGLSPSLRKGAMELLLSRPNWIGSFLDAVAENHIGRGELDPARIELLKEHPDRQVASRVRDLFKGLTLGDRGEVVQRYQRSLQLEGNPGRGKELFKKTCSACHQLDGVGATVGADLKGVRSQGAAALLLNILDPNRDVKPKFLSYVVQTTDGRVLSGLIRSESANTIILRQPDGKEVTLQRAEMERMRSTRLSFMPQGMEKQLDLQAMADLLAYLGR